MPAPSIEQVTTWPIPGEAMPTLAPSTPPTTISTQIITLHLRLGKRIPTLIYRHNGLPPLLARQYVLYYVSEVFSPNTVRSHLATIGLIYEWAWNQHNLNLDQYLVHHDLITDKLVDSLANHLRQRSPTRDGKAISNNRYNYHISTASEFLGWCLHVANRGHANAELQGALSIKRQLYQEAFHYNRMRTAQAKQVIPLNKKQVAHIRQTVGPIKRTLRSIEFPPSIFAPETALRNYLMVEIALECGLRLGELQKLQIASFPTGENKVVIMHDHDDPDDTRRREPRNKTAAREIPIFNQQLLADIKQYRLLPTEKGGRGRSESKYLFLETETGQPIGDAAQKIIQKLREYTGINHLHWHLFRHTWFYHTVNGPLRNAPDPLETMRVWGGWASQASMPTYSNFTLAEQAEEFEREYGETRYQLDNN